MKRCPHCGRELPLGAFYENRFRSGGFQSWCKDCSRESSRESARRSRRKTAAAEWDALQELRHRDDDLIEAAARHDTAAVHIAGIGDVVVELPPMEGGR